MKPNCDACGQALIWAKSERDKMQPITREPRENGNVIVFRLGGELHGRAVSNEVAEYLRGKGVPLRLNHFADCPQAERFR
jgi:hypothetical protein